MADPSTKRVARTLMYLGVERLIAETGGPRGWAVALAGPETGDVGPIRDLLGWPADKVLLVDRDERCVKAASKAWPEARSFHGELRDALGSPKSPAAAGEIGLLVADFQVFGEEEKRAIAAARGHLGRGGFVAVTYLRGREGGDGQPTVGARVRRGLGALPGANVDFLEMGRVVDVVDHLRDCFSAPHTKDHSSTTRDHSSTRENFLSLFLVRYNGRSPGMGIVAGQRVADEDMTPAWERAATQVFSDEERTGAVIGGAEAKDILRRLVHHLYDRLGVKRAASVLGIEPASVRAHIANRRR